MSHYLSNASHCFLNLLSVQGSSSTPTAPFKKARETIRRYKFRVLGAFSNLNDVLPNINNQDVRRIVRSTDDLNLLDRGESYSTRNLTTRHLTLLSFHAYNSNAAHLGFGRTQQRTVGTFREGGGRGGASQEDISRKSWQTCIKHTNNWGR